jgi:hypothetical protein
MRRDLLRFGIAGLADDIQHEPPQAPLVVLIMTGDATRGDGIIATGRIEPR